MCAQMSWLKGKGWWSLNEVIGVVGIGLKSLGFLLHAFLDFQDGRRLRLILQTMNKPEWLKQIEMGPSLLVYKFSLTRFVKISEFKNNDKLVKTK